MKIWLLTHENEQQKKTNTGRLVSLVLGESPHEIKQTQVSAEIIQWSRVHPNLELLDVLRVKKTFLIYPAKDAVICDLKDPVLGDTKTANIFDVDNYQQLKHSDLIILDGTWQQAQKIYNKSHYLHSLTKLHLITPRKSRYNLRRNQKNQGLCTVETVIEILHYVGHPLYANTLQGVFESFLAKANRKIEMSG